MSTPNHSPAAGGRSHWDERYDTVGSRSVSWYQSEPTASLAMIAAVGGRPGEALVDVGGGAGYLVDRLVAAGWTDLTVLDISGRALEEVRARLGPAATGVAWLREDLLAWQPRRTWDIWHDRAVFHFMVDPGQRTRYLATLTAAVPPGGHAILATFADDGPRTCSGLPVCRYRDTELLEALGPAWEPVRTTREVHRTPSGGDQPFTWVAARRTG